MPCVVWRMLSTLYVHIMYKLLIDSSIFKVRIITLPIKSSILQVRILTRIIEYAIVHEVESDL